MSTTTIASPSTPPVAAVVTSSSTAANDSSSTLLVQGASILGRSLALQDENNESVSSDDVDKTFDMDDYPAVSPQVAITSLALFNDDYSVASSRTDNSSTQDERNDTMEILARTDAIEEELTELLGNDAGEVITTVTTLSTASVGQRQLTVDTDADVDPDAPQPPASLVDRLKNDIAEGVQNIKKSLGFVMENGIRKSLRTRSQQNE